jgi:hypothetical protein
MFLLTVVFDDVDAAPVVGAGLPFVDPMGAIELNAPDLAVAD